MRLSRQDAADDIRRRLGFVRRRRTRMPRPLNLKKYEDRYHARIMELVRPYEDHVRKYLFPVLDVIVSQFKVRTDDPTDITDRTFDEIRVRFMTQFRDRDIEDHTARTALEINAGASAVFRQQMMTVLGVDPIQSEPWLMPEINTFVAENVSLIKTLPSEVFADIEQLVFREGRRGLSPQKIKAQILEQFGGTEYRARRIARDQVSKFNGRLTEVRQKQAGITKYTWQTSEDVRVRDSHEHLNGKVFSWDDPPVTVTSGKRAGERNHPGQDIQCRCHAIPYMGDILKR